VVKDLVKAYPRKEAGRPWARLLRFKTDASHGVRPAESDTVRAVDGIGFAIHRGESVGLVG
jgi:ABC-type oligopeptide transport system ATPase subunit